ncbi:MAG: c-type cytochrome [Arenicellales bacterium WSBS_2016_MAG_OTU3]
MSKIKIIAAAIAALFATTSIAFADGKKTYETSCIACHGTGVTGAPKLGDAEQWVSRIEQGMDVLTEHAIKGYQGKKGYMPAKGGNPTIPDENIKAAIEYMVSQSQ